MDSRILWGIILTIIGIIIMLIGFGSADIMLGFPSPNATCMVTVVIGGLLMSIGTYLLVARFKNWAHR